MSPYPCLHVLTSMSLPPCPCLHVLASMSLPPCPCLHVHVSISSVYVSMSNVSMSPFLHVSVSPSPCLHVSEIPQIENRANGKQRLPFVCCKRETEMANFRLFATNGNGNRKFVFLGRQNITDRRLLFPQTCPSMILLNSSTHFCISLEI